MKIFPLLISLCLPAAFVFADPGAAAPAKGVPAQARKDVACDFFNFDAMRKSESVGKALYDFIFSEAEDGDAPETAGTLIRKLNADYRMRLPETLESLSVTKIFSGDVPAMNLAIVKFRADGGNNPAKHFVAELKKRAAGAPAKNPETAFGQDLPEELARLLPRDFRENAERVSADAVENELSVLAWFPGSPDVGKTPEEDDFLNAKLAEFENQANAPGVLIFRAFPRREQPKTGDEKFRPSIPAGEFLLSEEKSAVKIVLSFHCIDGTEAENMLHFFALFKTNLALAAENSAAPELEPLKDVAQSVSVSRTADGMRIALLCPAEKFSALLKWHSLRFPKQPRQASGR